MPYAIAPPVILALAARTALSKLVLRSPPSFLDALLTGAWQGIGVYHAHAQYPPELALAAAAAVAGKLALDLLVWSEESTRVVAAVLGMVLGVLLLDIASRALEATELPPPERHRHGSARPSRSSKSKGKEKERDPDRDRDADRDDRSVKFRRRPSPDRPRTGDVRLRRMDSLENSIITAPSLSLSLPSISEVTDSTRRTTSPLQHEVQELRTRASLADTERRRFREEKKWAESQGNKARAEQMKWNIKRYTALMDSFNKEADRKVVEGARPASLLPSHLFSSSHSCYRRSPACQRHAEQPQRLAQGPRGCPSA
jgi:hypothetical protein